MSAPVPPTAFEGDDHALNLLRSPGCRKDPVLGWTRTNSSASSRPESSTAQIATDLAVAKLGRGAGKVSSLNIRTDSGDAHHLAVRMVNRTLQRRDPIALELVMWGRATLLSAPSSLARGGFGHAESMDYPPRGATTIRGSVRRCLARVDVLLFNTFDPGTCLDVPPMPPSPAPGDSIRTAPRRSWRSRTRTGRESWPVRPTAQLRR